MDLVKVVSLLVYTLGVYSFGALAILSLRQQSEPGVAARCSRRQRVSGWAMTLTGLVWFMVLLGRALLTAFPEVDTRPLDMAMFGMTFAWPSLIVTLADSDSTEPGSLASRWSVALLHLSAVGMVTAFLLVHLQWIELPFKLWPAAGFIQVGMFAFAAIHNSLTFSRKRKDDETINERSSRRVMAGMFGGMVVLCVAIVLVAFSGQEGLSELLSLVGTSLPLAFVFAGHYYENRSEFFDLFVKRGIALLVTIVLLTCYFALTLPWLSSIELDWARPWVFAVLLLPLVMLLPRIYRTLGVWIDNAWLGRQFTSAEAVKHFLSSMQRACTEQELLNNAAAGLSQIFKAPARIELELHEAPGTPFPVAQHVAIRSGDRGLGVIRLGTRDNQLPYFSEDLKLLDSLAEVLSYMLENMRLQEKKQEQQKKLEEAALHASRSELKALRAQINPHFLFNALNAIAGLIHKDPARADQTVEQLAEIFRYTLRRADCEWTRLDCEMDFVRAYLDVEQARFGQRLQFDVEFDETVAELRVPTMMIQTLVENAVKHGLASIRKVGKIGVAARSHGASLLIEVSDNGSGFHPEANRRTPESKGEGYGLRNIQERLNGYFGDAAELRVRRDEADGTTVVSISFPLATLRASAVRPEQGSQGVA